MKSTYFRATHLLIVGTVILLAALVACADSNVVPTPTLIPFTRYDNENAFSMLYPRAWQYVIMTEGIIAFSTPEALNLSDESAASVLVYRQAPGRVTDLQEAFDHFLNNGPYASGFTAVHDQVDTFVGGDSGSGRQAFEIQVARAASDELAGSKSLVVTTQSENGATYIISATAPDEVWDEWLPNFRVMLGSFQVNE